MSNEPTSLDYDRLLRKNLLDVFGERDAARRLDTIRELYAPDAKLVDPEGIARGHDALNDQVTALLAMLGPDFAFIPVGPAIGHHEAGRLQWQGGAPDAPPAITGTDVALFEAGRIKTLYVFVDPPHSEPESETRNGFPDNAERNG